MGEGEDEAAEGDGGGAEGGFEGLALGDADEDVSGGETQGRALRGGGRDGGKLRPHWP